MKLTADVHSMHQQVLWLRFSRSFIVSKLQQYRSTLRRTRKTFFFQTKWDSYNAYNIAVGGYHLENFGCRATQADGASIERQLLDSGLERSCATDAQVAILNTCTITAAADADARAAIRRIQRENPDCRILVTGCYAQRAPKEIAALPGVSWVIGNSHKNSVAAIVTKDILAAPEDACGRKTLPAHVDATHDGRNFVPLRTLSPSGASLLVGDIFAHTELLAAPVFESAADGPVTRPNLKVQDGCDNRCSFCVVPFVRGQSRSLKLDAVLREVDALVAAGYREIVASGINLGRWGRDLAPPQRFEGLLRTVLDRTAIDRIRISSVEPMDWSDELIELVASSPRISKHAHVPLQSGSDCVLRMMHRKYRPWHYAERINKIRAAMPDAAIGADVMAGFPGETDALFEESRAFIDSLPLTYLHVFTYSSRPGTKAAAMPEHVPTQVARQRNRVLRDLAAEKNLYFRQSFVGRELEAISLQQDGGHTEALTNNFLKLRLSRAIPPNQLLRACITGVTEQSLVGEVLQ